MRLSKFELFWLLAERQRDLGNTESAKDLILRALDELEPTPFPLVLKTSYPDTFGSTTFDFDPPARPVSLEDYRQVRSWYAVQKARFDWWLLKTRCKRRSRRQ